MFQDTHCHIFKEYYEDINKIIEEAKQNNINHLINNGCNHKSNIEVLSLIEKYPSMYGAIGIHPEEVDKYRESDIEFIENNLSNLKIVAIGEIGLDYYYTKDNKAKQIALFEKQLSIAEKYNLPVIVHSREATEDTINILKKYKVTGTIHSFSGSKETAQIYINMGYMLGINGVITFKNSHLKDTLKEISVNNIILETDSPYLTPVPYRGHKNSPAYILDIAKFIADYNGITLEELSKITSDNVKKIYQKIHFE